MWTAAGPSEMLMKLWKMIAVGATLALAAGAVSAQSPEKKDIKLGVGGAAALYYLPLALTEKLGHFKEQGLNVEVSDFKGGSQSLTALVGGSADVVTGAYEHTLRMQAKGQDILAVIELGRYPGIALGVKPDDASFVGVGATSTAIAAVQRGEIDAISNVDPVMSKLQTAKEIVILA